MNTELAVQNSNAVIQQGVGFGDSGDSLKPVPMILTQRTTKGYEDVPSGRFVDSASGEVFSEVKFIPLEVRTTRTLYPHAKQGKPFRDGEKPLCVSRDGLVPLKTEGLQPQAATCAQCKYSKWDNMSGGKPACKEGRRITFIEKETGLPYSLTATGRSVKEVKDLVTGLQRKALATKAKVGHTANLYDFEITMKTVNVETEFGSGYVTHFTKATLLGPEDEDYSVFYQQYIEAPKQRYLASLNAPKSTAYIPAPQEEVSDAEIEDVIDAEPI